MEKDKKNTHNIYKFKKIDTSSISSGNKKSFVEKKEISNKIKFY